MDSGVILPVLGFGLELQDILGARSLTLTACHSALMLTVICAVDDSGLVRLLEQHIKGSANCLYSNGIRNDRKSYFACRTSLAP